MNVREYFPGLGTAVADRTINRPGETWGDVAHRVALGNSLLVKDAHTEFDTLYHHLKQASVLMSGRHLQHGDADQPNRPMEVFTNCSSAMFRFLTKKLLLSGSGVGGCYDDDLMIIDWAMNMPIVVCTIDGMHPDANQQFTDLRAAKHFYRDAKVTVHVVEDSREGWAKAIELIERITYEGWRYQEVVLLDFSKVRGKGRPIKGMQNRPASGPIPLMEAIRALAAIRGSGMAPWLSTMYADHLLAQCVLVGGARRAARIAVKYWKDATIFDFVSIKRPTEFTGLSREQVMEMRSTGAYFESFLWSSNNSVAVDREFWDRIAHVRSTGVERDEMDTHAFKLWNMVMDYQYGDGTGEPGFLNVDRLETDLTDIDQYLDNAFAGSELYKIDEESKPMMREMVEAVLRHPYQYIVNPCGEIAFFLLGAFCVIADVVLYHTQDDADAESAVRAAARALIRTNLMNSVYDREVKRTNRIGVGFTGLHEYIWDRYGLAFRDVIAYGDVGPMKVTEEAAEFWDFLLHLGDAVDDECEKYSAFLGVTVPHTNKTMKPSGTISKLFGLTEGAHLPSMRKLLRWVQFRSDDPLLDGYLEAGYPTRELASYPGTTIVGFPTAPMITTLGMGDKLITAPEATPEEQFRWLQLLEYYWLGTKGKGNQISYTLKYDPKKITFAEFEQMMFDNVKTVRAVSVQPIEDTSSYEYLPEQPISDFDYDELVAAISVKMGEDVDRVHLACDNGACPISFEKDEVNG